jgi:hypothetical protein
VVDRVVEDVVADQEGRVVEGGGPAQVKPMPRSQETSTTTLPGRNAERSSSSRKTSGLAVS